MGAADTFRLAPSSRSNRREGTGRGSGEAARWNRGPRLGKAARQQSKGNGSRSSTWNSRHRTDGPPSFSSASRISRANVDPPLIRGAIATPKSRGAIAGSFGSGHRGTSGSADRARQHAKSRATSAAVRATGRRAEDAVHARHPGGPNAVGDGNAVRRRPETEDAAEVRRHPDRTGEVGSHVEWRETRSHRRHRSSARSAGRPTGVVGLDVRPNCSLFVCIAFDMFVLPSRIAPAAWRRSAMTLSWSGMRSLARVPTERRCRRPQSCLSA